MTEADVGTFDRAFRRFVGAFRVKLRAADVDELSVTFFRVLSDAPLDDVLAAGKRLLQTSKRFPVPADWLAEIHAPGLVAAAAAADVRTMTVDESTTYAHAERQRYVGEPCSCWRCDAAGVTHRPLRFVPDVDATGRDERARTQGGRLVTPGRWLHGDELAAWYGARETFFARVPRTARRRFAHVVRALREPGEEG